MTFIERRINPHLGLLGNNITGSATDPWQTAEQAYAYLNAVVNPNRADRYRLIIDTRQKPLYTEDVGVFINPNVKIIDVWGEGTIATEGRADIRPWKHLNSLEFYQPDATNYPHVWATNDSQAFSVLWHWSGNRPWELCFYRRLRPTSGYSIMQIAEVFGGTPGFYSTGLAALEAHPGTYHCDGYQADNGVLVNGTIYFHPFDSLNPRTDGKLYVRSRVRLTDLGASGFHIEGCTFDVRNILIGGVELNKNLDVNGQSGGNGMKLIPGDGYNYRSNCKIYAWGSHGDALTNGAPGFEFVSDDDEFFAGAVATGDVSTISPFAVQRDLSATVTYRRTKCLANVGKIGSYEGAINPNFGLVQSHAGSAAQGYGQYVAMTFEDINAPNQNIADSETVNEGYFDVKGVKHGGFQVRGTKPGACVVGNVTARHALCENVLFDRGHAVIDSRNDMNAASLNGLYSIMRDCVIRGSSFAYGTNRVIGDIQFHRCLLDYSNGLNLTGDGAAFERPPFAPRLKLTMIDCVYLSAPGRGVGGQHSMLMQAALWTDDFSNMRNNRYHRPAGDIFHPYFTFAGQQTGAAWVTFTQWQALGFDKDSFIAGTEVPVSIKSVSLDEFIADAAARFVAGDSRAVWRKVTALKPGERVTSAVFTIENTEVEKLITPTSAPLSGYIPRDGGDDNSAILGFNLGSLDTRKMPSGIYDYQIHVSTNLARELTPEGGKLQINRRLSSR